MKRACRKRKGLEDRSRWSEEGCIHRRLVRDPLRPNVRSDVEKGRAGRKCFAVLSRRDATRRYATRCGAQPLRSNGPPNARVRRTYVTTTARPTKRPLPFALILARPPRAPARSRHLRFRRSPKRARDSTREKDPGERERGEGGGGGEIDVKCASLSTSLPTFISVRVHYPLRLHTGGFRFRTHVNGFNIGRDCFLPRCPPVAASQFHDADAYTHLHC